MEPLKFAIITPSHSRRRFIPAVIRQVKNQTREDWMFLYVQDGPDPRSRKAFNKRANGDPRMRYFETERWFNDWGATPRLKGMEALQSDPQPPDYVVFWDDDNYFHPRALQEIHDALEAKARPGMLMVPIQSGVGLRPLQGKSVEDYIAGDVDTANFVVRLDVAIEAARLAGKFPPSRIIDFLFFEAVRSNERCRIEMSEIEPIGYYDGLRPLMRLRWKLRIPTLNIGDAWWWRRIREALRG